VTLNLKNQHLVTQNKTFLKVITQFIGTICAVFST